MFPLTSTSHPETGPMIHTNRPDRRQSGFTLVEILVVITILSILVALLVPAITGAVTTARNAQVTGEINLLAQALASFKNQYNDFPPSRIILREDGYYGSLGSAGPTTLDAVTFYRDTSVQSQFRTIGDPPYLLDPSFVGSGKPYDPSFDLSYEQLAERSVRYLRKFFPKVALKTSGTASIGAGSLYGDFYDFNGNGRFDANPILLQGHECLVFFLGGIPSYVTSSGGGTTGYGMLGFGNNPQNPFVNDYTKPSFAGAPVTNRQRPIFEFKGDRLIDDDGDGIPGYIDPLGTQDTGRYYAYFSSYGGGGYDPNDVNLELADDLVWRPFRVSFTSSIWVQSPAPNPYTSTAAAPNYDPTKSPAQAGARPATYQNNETYQIISAGRDRLYGYGGQYTSAAGQTPLPLDPPAPADASLRIREGDNLTNFASSKLE
jgi:prepilin-type N-terminal cleavage/methylation domain-containing protein